ncbi:hypothetical protein NK213_04605 [Sebaldella sp. S0638]|nr:hypothetical protein [Sebaldella sp. S0638]MCP1223683.1 hypothetical protein [Sebaldella sp. S0638]
MKKLLLFFLMGIMTVLAYSAENDDIQVTKSLEDSITKDYDQDGVYSSYEKALRGAQGSIYVTLPEKRGYWYTMLDRIKAEEEELMPDEQARMRRKK